ncbi:hypothetical protein [Cribrihabitans marinus]|uniref:hypothetical protein n=1 Tax=Cribrihabitans marinus TaxID=1227549 RepID=UPI00166E7058|nr:hypothetical protein [Cribrihabitans marinus]
MLAGFAVWWLVVGYADKVRRAEDPVYATELFANLLPVEEILATRKWHPRGAGLDWDCTYAIARLKDSRPEEPPTRGRAELGWRYQFGGNWRPTPAPKLGDTTRDALSFCSRYWSGPLAEELNAALKSPGSWFDRGAVGATLFIYAPDQRLAARIRFDD